MPRSRYTWSRWIWYLYQSVTRLFSLLITPDWAWIKFKVCVAALALAALPGRRGDDLLERLVLLADRQDEVPLGDHVLLVEQLHLADFIAELILEEVLGVLERPPLPLVVDQLRAEVVPLGHPDQGQFGVETSENDLAWSRNPNGLLVVGGVRIWLVTATLRIPFKALAETRICRQVS